MFYSKAWAQHVWEKGTCLQGKTKPNNPRKGDLQSWICWEDLKTFPECLELSRVLSLLQPGQRKCEQLTTWVVPAWAVPHWTHGTRLQQVPSTHLEVDLEPRRADGSQQPSSLFCSQVKLTQFHLPTQWLDHIPTARHRPAWAVN